MIRVNVAALVDLTRLYLPGMLERDQGSGRAPISLGSMSLATYARYLALVASLAPVR